jgi:membrane-associated phospholipid phosphatase
LTADGALCEGRPRDASGAPAKKDDPLQSFWQFVTDLGDSAVTLPLAAVTLLYLSLAHWQRAAAALAVSLAAGGFAIALLKLALQSCGYHLLQTTLVNPSGHVALSTMIYGALAIILGGGLSGWWRSAVHGVFILLIVAIALSRLMLHAHNQAEVLAGLLVGLGALAIFHRLRGPALPGGLRVSRLALVALLLVGTMHGTRWPIEEQIRIMVALIQAGVPQCA